MNGRKRGKQRSAGAVDKTIGARVRARRLMAGVSQETLAQHLGVSFQQVQKYEKGVNRVSAATLLDIAEALNAPVLSLLPIAEGCASNGFADDPEVAAFAPLLAGLNSEGRRALTLVARAFARDPKLCAGQLVRDRE